MPKKLIALTLSAVLISAAALSAQTLPASFDLRNVDGKNFVTSVKSQSGGTCWTHGAMAAMEGNLMITGNWLLYETGEPDLSEYHLDWWNGFNLFNNDDIPHPPAQGLTVHEGGDYRVTSAYISRGEGPVRETDAPSFSTPSPRDSSSYSRYYVPEILWYTDPGDENRIPRIKRALMEHGVIGTCMCYKPAFYSSSLNAHYQSLVTADDPNHAVAIIGWDDNRVTQASDPGAWLCKNSWGSSWGDRGYFWIAYGDKHAGRHDEMGAVSFQGTDVMPYDRVYFHDYHGWRATKTDADEAVNCFTAEADERLRAVSIFTAADSVDYQIIVYSSFEDGTLSREMTSRSGFAAVTGYHTVSLDRTAPLTKDEPFYIYTRLSRGGHPYDCTSVVPVLLGASTMNTTVPSSASPGESYYYDGSDWKDLTSFDATANFCMKALTIDTAAAVTIGDVTAGYTDTVLVPVQVKNLRNVTAVSLSVTFDPQVLSFLSLSGQPDGVNFSAESTPGSAVFQWQDSARPLSVENGRLFTIMFEYSGKNSSISFDGQGTYITLANGTVVREGFTGGSITEDLSEPLAYLTHDSGDFRMSIFNEGSIGSDNKDPGDESGVYWKQTNGAYVGGIIFGTAARGSVNGLLGSFRNVDNSLATDLTNVESRFSAGFTSDEHFDQISRAVYSDASAADPYSVTIIQTAYTRQGSSFGIIRYGFVNHGSTPLNEFHAGIFMDWDVGAYNSNSGGWSEAEQVTYVYGSGQKAVFGIAALDSLSGFCITDRRSSLGGGDGIRTASYSFISSAVPEIPETGDLRAWTGSRVGDIAPGDTGWVTFAVVCGEGVSGVLESARSAAAAAGEAAFIPAPAEVPEAYRLFQNYPNPFNAGTAIRYDLGAPGDVRLTLYNTLGQQIAVLVDRFHEAGTYEISLDSRNLASGLYFCRLSAGGFSKTRKMVLLR